MTIVEQLLDWKADGIISDCKKPSLRSYEAGADHNVLTDPSDVRRLVKHRGLPVAPKYPKQRVLSCLESHLSRQAAFKS